MSISEQQGKNPYVLFGDKPNPILAAVDLSAKEVMSLTSLFPPSLRREDNDSAWLLSLKESDPRHILSRLVLQVASSALLNDKLDGCPTSQARDIYQSCLKALEEMNCMECELAFATTTDGFSRADADRLIDATYNSCCITGIPDGDIAIFDRGNEEMRDETRLRTYLKVLGCNGDELAQQMENIRVGLAKGENTSHAFRCDTRFADCLGLRINYVLIDNPSNSNPMDNIAGVYLTTALRPEDYAACFGEEKAEIATMK